MIQTEVSRLRLQENVSITPARSMSIPASAVYRSPGRCFSLCVMLVGGMFYFRRMERFFADLT